MPRRAYARRFDRLAQESGQASAAMAMAVNARCAHSARVGRAVARAVSAGIPMDRAYPPVLRSLANLGLRLRPVHYQPLWLLVLFGAAFGLVPVGLVAGMTDLLGGAQGPLAMIHLAGWPGVLAVLMALGAVHAALVQLQAARAGLPPWDAV